MKDEQRGRETRKGNRDSQREGQREREEEEEDEERARLCGSMYVLFMKHNNSLALRKVLSNTLSPSDHRSCDKRYID